MNIIVYNITTGIISRCVSCPPDMEAEQCGVDEAYIEHEWVDDSKYKVDLDTLDVVPIDPEP